MSPILESEIEQNVVKWARKKGFLTPKVRFAENGWPDRLFISPKGHTIFIEMKRPGEVPDPLQEYRMVELRKRGIPAFWCDTYLEALNILLAALEPETVSEASRKAIAVASVSRLVSGSRSGKNINCPGIVKNPLRERDDPEGPNYSADIPDV